MAEVQDVDNSAHARPSAHFDFNSNRNQIMFLSESHNTFITMAGAAPVSEVPRHAPVCTERAAEHVERADVKVAANDNQGGITLFHGCDTVIIVGVRDDFVSQTPTHERREA